MASCKILWCTIILAVSFTDASPRRKPGPYEESSGDSPGFRFGEEYFSPEATQIVSEKQKNPDGCEKVIRDSMVCMVCRNPDTNAKYEQCSYVPHQSDKSYSYAGSDRQKPRNYESPQSQLREGDANSRKESLEEESGESEEAKETKPYSGYYGSGSESKESEESPSSRSSSSPSRSYDEASGEYAPESERVSERVDESNCKEEKRDDGMTCKVCTNPKSGRNFEKCAYAYEPNDKVYKFTRSSSFGNSRDKSKGKAPKKAIRRVDDKEHQNVEDKSPEKSRSAEKQINDNCREVVRDSMTCTVCTDLKTGRNSEQCSYSYDPADKLFTYSQSRSFGSKDQPKRAENVKKTNNKE